MTQRKTTKNNSQYAPSWEGRRADRNIPVLNGTESPALLAHLNTPLQVVRAFAFVDLCGFTSYTDEHGPLAARRVITSFRTSLRDATERRGVRVAKWMGDGALLICVDTAPLVCCVVDAVSRMHTDELDMRGGVSTGPVMYVDGDDFVGRALNLASRLCDMAAPGEVLVDGDSSHGLPGWISSEPYRSVTVKGLGKRRDIQSLRIAEGQNVPAWSIA